MPDELTARAVASMYEQLQGAERPVTYTRGEESVELQALVGRTLIDVADELGTVLRGRVQDYLIDAADLVLPETGAVTPRAGDTITDGSVVYEVQTVGDACYRRVDPWGKKLRVHTRAT